MSLHGEGCRSLGKAAEFLFDDFNKSISKILEHECKPLDKEIKVDCVNHYLEQAAFTRHKV